MNKIFNTQKYTLSQARCILGMQMAILTEGKAPCDLEDDEVGVLALGSLLEEAARNNVRWLITPQARKYVLRVLAVASRR